MVDGYLPASFPAPIPDDGGIDPDTGEPVPGAADNKVVDPSEFTAATYGLLGSLSGGNIYVAESGDTVTTPADVIKVQTLGNESSLQSSTTGNVVLTGTESDPILLNGDIAIDGDVIIQGYVKGEGSLIVSGNVYVPSDVVYLDGT